MNHNEDPSNRQFVPSLDSGPEDDEEFDYSKLLSRESNSDPVRQARADRTKANGTATADAPRTGRSPSRARAT